MNRFFLLFPAVLLAGLSCSREHSPRETAQMIVVLTPAWDASSGSMQRFERPTPRSRWLRVGPAVPVVVGRNGMARGRGLHPMAGNDPEKQEGDGRSPAGMFSIKKTFGYAAPGEMGHVRMPYVQATRTLRCVDDVDSRHYNRVVDQEKLDGDWHSAEFMLREDNLYRLGLIVDHNTDPCEPGAGSCIFLHIWKDPETGTAGCTAMASEHMESLLRWLRPEKDPVLVQLPGFAYDEMRGPWDLP